MDIHLKVPSFNAAGNSAPSSRASSLSRTSRSSAREGSVAEAPPSRSGAQQNVIKRMNKDLNDAMKKCENRIKEIKANETLLASRLDDLIFDDQGAYDAAIGHTKKIIEYKHAAIAAYDAAISRFASVSSRVLEKGIEPTGTLQEKLDMHPEYLAHRERADASLVAFESFLQMLEGERCMENEDESAANERYALAVDKLIVLPREHWGVVLRSAPVPRTSVWTVGSEIKNNERLDVRKLIEIGTSYESEERQKKEKNIENEFFRTHYVFNTIDNLESVLPDEEDVSEESTDRLGGYLSEFSALFKESEVAQETREAIAYLNQSMYRLDAEKDVTKRTDIKAENVEFKRRYASETFAMSTLPLHVQLFHLRHAQFYLELNTEASAAFNQVVDKLDDLIAKHPRAPQREGKMFFDLDKLSAGEMQEMYAKLAILPTANNEAARHLRYLMDDLKYGLGTPENGGIQEAIALLDTMAGDLELAAHQAEILLGELILAGVKPGGEARSESAGPGWKLQLAHSDADEQSESGSTVPSGAVSKRSSLIRSRGNSLIGAGQIDLSKLDLSERSGIGAAKAYGQRIEENIDVLGRQAEVSKRHADAILSRLRGGKAGANDTPNAIYELLQLAADRKQDQARDIRKLIRKWEGVRDPNDEVRQRIADLARAEAGYRREAEELGKQAVRKKANAVALRPTAEGARFLHQHGLIERMERPRWLMLPKKEYDAQNDCYVQKKTDGGEPMVDYIHEWPIRIKPDPDEPGAQDYIFYAHDHKKQDTEHPHPETLTESAVVTWKNHFYHDKGRLWELSMGHQGGALEATKVQRRFSDERTLTELAGHYLDETQRIPVPKYPVRPGRGG